MYADDIALISSLERDLQNMLNILHNWCIKWRMKLNINKSKIVDLDCAQTYIKKNNELHIEQVFYSENPVNIDWDKEKLCRNFCEQWPNQIQNVSKLCTYIKFKFVMSKILMYVLYIIVEIEQF